MTAYTTQIEHGQAGRTARDRVGKLLSRYPNLPDRDRKEILTFMKEARHLDIGLLTANDNLRPQLDAFMADHKHHFQIDIFDVVRVLTLIGAALMVCWLLWELVRPVSL